MKSLDGKTGSIGLSTLEKGPEMLNYKGEKVLYDTGPLHRKPDSQPIVRGSRLRARVRCIRGLEKWKSAGYALEAHAPDSRTGVYAPTAHTNMRSAGECGGELEAQLHQGLRTFAGWFSCTIAAQQGAEKELGVICTLGG